MPIDHLISLEICVFWSFGHFMMGEFIFLIKEIYIYQTITTEEEIKIQYLNFFPILISDGLSINQIISISAYCLSFA